MNLLIFIHTINRYRPHWSSHWSSLVLRTNVATGFSGLQSIARARRERNAKLVVVDPYRTPNQNGRDKSRPYDPVTRHLSGWIQVFHLNVSTIHPIPSCRPLFGLKKPSQGRSRYAVTHIYPLDLGKSCFNLENEVGSQKYAQALDAHEKSEKSLITKKVTSGTPPALFSYSPCTSISCTSVSRPTASSRFKKNQCNLLTPVVSTKRCYRFVINSLENPGHFRRSG